MEAPKVENISHIRAYVFDYIVGVVWLLAFALWLASPEMIVALFTSNPPPAEPKTSNIPEFAQGFLLTIGGVVVPYAVSTILKPLSLRLMSLSLYIQRSIGSRQKSEPQRLRLIATQAVRKTIGLPKEIDVTRLMQHAFLQGRHSAMSAAASRWEEDLYFRVTLIIPSAMIVGTLTLQHSPWCATATSIISLLVVIGFGAWLTNRAFEAYIDCLDFSTILAAKYPCIKCGAESSEDKS